ncbi:MAG TPA: hypothetical protein VFA20_30370 [Myxococcaceae bacterium]|nr:hypothetical protein [Myxococcaceae bacterium]
MALEDYSWLVDRDGRCFVRWQGRVVRVLTGAKARKVIDAIADGDEAARLAIARLTGNFKRGNERR